MVRARRLEMSKGVQVLALTLSAWGCSTPGPQPQQLDANLAQADIRVDVPELSGTDAIDTAAPDLDPCPGGCDDHDPCTGDTCTASGCVHVPTEGNVCAEASCAGSVWHSARICHAGTCSPGASSDCHDGNVCTDDSCTPAGCVHTSAEGEPCGPGGCIGLLFRGTSTCIASTCTPAPAMPCDDGNPCTLDTCSASQGCQHAFSGAPCDDGDACTMGEVCAQGSCGSGSPKSCGDGNPCTTDTCKAKIGCVHGFAAGACDDGNPCTSGDLCGAGVCVGGFAKDCQDGSACTVDSCSKGICLHVIDSKACDDGNACTTDACQGASGCVHLPATGVCVGPTCAGGVFHPGGQCLSGACVSQAAVACQDANACTLDSCSAQGCQHVATTSACEDGNACTVGDLCKAGVCASGKAKSCDDGNACTSDTCVGGGCVATPLANGSACDDGVACTSGDVCSGGACVGKTTSVSQSYGNTTGTFTAVRAASSGLVVAGWLGKAGSLDTDGWLTRLDGNGGVLWSRTFGGSADDQFTSLAAVSGGYVLAGFTGSLGAGGIDGWLLRTDEAGNLLGQTSFGGDKFDAFYGVVALANGDAALAGVTGDSAWLVRTDAQGKLVWQQTFETGQASAWRTAATADGGLALAGSAQTAQGPRARLIRTDGDGTVLWAQDYTGTPGKSEQPGWDRQVFAVTALADGFALAGQLDADAGPRAWLVRTDAVGKLLWTQTYGAAGVESAAHGLVALTGGGFAVVGSAGSDALVVRTDAQGLVQAQGVLADALGLAAVAAGPELRVVGRKQGLAWMGKVMEGCGF